MTINLYWRRYALRSLAGLAIALAGFCSGGVSANDATDVLTIATASGDEISFSVEIARTPAERSLGLMHRDRLDPEKGMLFIYEVEQPVDMWMRNTKIPLDMLFIGVDGIIVKIHERAVPYSEEIISSEKPVVAVLEVNGGTASRLGLRPGDLVSLPEGVR
jgi:uncharacterized protein